MKEIKAAEEAKACNTIIQANLSLKNKELKLSTKCTLIINEMMRKCNI